MAAEVDNIITLLQRAFEGGSWHGPSVREAIKDVSQDSAQARLPDTHSIVELVGHITAWRTYAIRKLSGDDGFKVTDEMNFPGDTEWAKAVAALEQSQEILVDLLRQLSEDKLMSQVPGSGQPLPFYVLLHGIIHHDLYHAGQIILIKKATAKQSL